MDLIKASSFESGSSSAMISYVLIDKDCSDKFSYRRSLIVDYCPSNGVVRKIIDIR